MISFPLQDLIEQCGNQKDVAAIVVALSYVHSALEEISDKLDDTYRELQRKS